MADIEQILDGEEETVEVEEAPEEQPTEETSEEAAEAPTEPETIEEPEKAVEVEKPPQTEAEQALIGVVSSLRAELREIKSGLPQREAPKAPDFYDDPQGAVRHEIAPVQQALLSSKLETSRFMAEREFGKETVEAAFNYFNEHPEQSQALLNHPSPFHAAVETFNQQRVAREIGSDPDGWRKREREAIRKELEAEMVAEQVKNVGGKPAPSMADVTGTGGGAKTNWAGPAKLDDLIG